MDYPMYKPSVLDQFVEDTAEHFTDDLRNCLRSLKDA